MQPPCPYCGDPVFTEPAGEHNVMGVKKLMMPAMHYHTGCFLHGLTVSKAEIALGWVERWNTRTIAALPPAAPELARHQPCGCIVCRCESDEQCSGCGAKNCGTHAVGEIPSPVYVTTPDPVSEAAKVERVAKTINGPRDVAHIGAKKLHELQDHKWINQTTPRERIEMLSTARAAIAALRAIAEDGEDG